MAKSDMAREAFEPKGVLRSIKEAVLEVVPSLANFGDDVSKEAGRLVRQGASELAMANYAGTAFVPYGPGQNAPEAGNDGPSAAEKFNALATGAVEPPAPEPAREQSQEMER